MDPKNLFYLSGTIFFIIAAFLALLMLILMFLPMVFGKYID